MKNRTIKSILEEYPFASDFFESNRLETKGYENFSIEEYIKEYKSDEVEDEALDISDLDIQLSLYIDQMKEFLGIDEGSKVKSLSIIAGNNKSGEKENFERLDIHASQIVAIVGPTGSGKSRLLADIEWAARADTPTKRTILINNEMPDLKWRYSTNKKLVAQLSQNMNFVMDLSVVDFVKMHAASRMVENPDEVARKILEEANKLAGETFLETTPVTSLSGGQSRALMIADTAILSSSPIVLIDEIENAGIDRNKAIELLISRDKIVLIATHDPLLALRADKRIVIKNGGIYKIIETSDEEKNMLSNLEEIDKIVTGTRAKLRAGELLDSKDFLFLGNE
jgi:ABC transporter, ATP-binding protein